MPERPFVAAPPLPSVPCVDATARFWGPDFFTDGGVLWKSFFVKKSFVGDGVMMVALHVSKAARTSGELLRNLCISSVRWGDLPTGSWNKLPHILT